MTAICLSQTRLDLEPKPDVGITVRPSGSRGAVVQRNSTQSGSAMSVTGRAQISVTLITGYWRSIRRVCPRSLYDHGGSARITPNLPKSAKLCVMVTADLGEVSSIRCDSLNHKPPQRPYVCRCQLGYHSMSLDRNSCHDFQKHHRSPFHKHSRRIYAFPLHLGFPANPRGLVDSGVRFDRYSYY